MAEALRPEGIADPVALRDSLDAVDAAILQLVATRTRLMNEVQDAFTGLRSSAQLFREIFFGLELPIDSPDTLIKQAGGPYRLIAVSHKETGYKVFALADVLKAIPNFDQVFPIKSFERLGDQLERIREKDPGAEATWFANDISMRRLPAALRHEADLIASGAKRTSVLARTARTSVVCGCCGEHQSPAGLVATAFANLSSSTGATRWTGKPVRDKRARGAVGNRERG